MLNKKWILLLQIVLIFFALFVSLGIGKEVSAKKNKKCHTEWVEFNCGKPWPCDKQIIVCDEDEDPPPECNPISLKCSTACGLSGSCQADGCGGQTCCPATAACCFSVKLDCSNTCGQPAKCTSDGCGGQSCCPATLKCAPTPTPPTYCKSDQSCPINQECYQSPSRSMAYCQPMQCPKQSLGDANCDQAVNTKDYEGVFKPKMIGLPYPCDKCTADFDKNKIVNVLDYEIWRNSVFH